MNGDKITLKACPDEVTLAKYINGELSAEERKALEGHISTCQECLFNMSEAETAVAGSKRLPKGNVMDIKNEFNIWFFISLFCFSLSFIIPRFFFQFLTGAAITGLKWIMDNRNTKLLIMIHQAWNNRNDEDINVVMKKINDRLGKR